MNTKEMAKQNLKVGDPLPFEGIDKDFLTKSMIAYENIERLLFEAEKKQNLPVILSNVERLKSMVKYYLKNASMLDARIKYYQQANQQLEGENQKLINENLLLICQSKSRDAFRQAKEGLESIFGEQ